MKSTLGSPLLTELRKTIEHPIVNVATSIEKLLGDVEEILPGEGVLTVIQSLNAFRLPPSFFNQSLAKIPAEERVTSHTPLSEFPPPLS